MPTLWRRVHCGHQPRRFFLRAPIITNRGPEANRWHKAIHAAQAPPRSQILTRHRWNLCEGPSYAFCSKFHRHLSLSLHAPSWILREVFSESAQKIHHPWPCDVMSTHSIAVKRKVNWKKFKQSNGITNSFKVQNRLLKFSHITSNITTAENVGGSQTQRSPKSLIPD